MNEEIQKDLERRARTKQLIKDLDAVELWNTLFIEELDTKMIRYLYTAMHRKGKKFTQIRQAIGYTFTRKQ